MNKSQELSALAVKPAGLQPSSAQDRSIQSRPSENQAADHFKREGDLVYAGKHLIADFWEASGLDDMDLVDNALRSAVQASGATLLHIHLHHFSPYGGISGVAVLAESHISVHTWPENGFAAFDVFMCGDAEPELAIPVLRDAFRPAREDIQVYRRGIQD
ncbi:MAG: adenosylmethionine decarboxylase [Spirochaetales bacterium]|nr:adenosylmethionine decarboxylase [Leptospiraceae bacterium]MCP5483150.1 adenosylmethionine decarboxylase [Spirochaetales bacterium]MCP5484590.1 adenosylmethionine decarboxylase [Spirochaetales bacterium]